MSILDKASLIQIPSGYKSTKLYSLRPSNGDGDFTFARSSSGTRVNSEGLIETAQVVSTTELVTNGDFDTDSDWNKGTGWTISGGTANNNGASGSNNLSQSSILVVGKKYKIDITVSNYVSGNVQVSAGASPRDTMTANGTYTFYQTCTPNNNFYIIANSFNGSIDNVSVKEVFENDVPRLDYSDGSCACLLLEGQRTNLLTYSNDFTQWTIQSGVTATHNTTETLSPDGTNNATKFVGNGTSGVLKSAPVTGVVARSIYLKSVSGTVNVILKDPIFTVTQKSLSVTTEWQRFDLIEDNTHSSTQGLWVDDIPSSGIYMWGGQLESGDYSTSLINTSGSTVTRTADVCTNAGTSATFNDSEGVLFFEGSTLVESGITRVISISDGSTSNNIYFNFNQYSNSFNCEVLSGGSSQFNPSVTMTKVNNNKIALKYKANDFALWINGTEVATDTSGSTPTGLDRLNFDLGQGSFDFEGKCKQLMTFNEALSDEELSDLTGQVNLSFNNLATFYGYTIL